ncbi:response regulator [Archangium violaceum]|uniref:response regulator n=1 Tax=Archangium violaceum TaxID=83451 RepID=UPI00193B7C08|nr:response regulator [Archangium violaceum]QRK09394.1 response regulator [Archangium violaceum]
MTSILVVEDEFDVQQVVADVLRDEGYEVSVCGNGRDALERLREHRPDVVVMDVMMPILSGAQALEQIRKTPGLDGVPVILMSEMPPRSGEPRLWQAFLKKPFRLEQLLNAVARVIPGGASSGSR